MRINKVNPRAVRTTSKKLSRAAKLAKLAHQSAKVKKIAKQPKKQIVAQARSDKPIKEEAQKKDRLSTQQKMKKRAMKKEKNLVQRQVAKNVSQSEDPEQQEIDEEEIDEINEEENSGQVLDEQQNDEQEFDGEQSMQNDEQMVQESQIEAQEEQSEKPKAHKSKEKKKEKSKPVEKEPENQEEEELVPLDHQCPEEGSSKTAWYFSDKKFADYQFSQQTLKALQKNNFVNMTHIQARTMPLLMRGKDVLGAAKTGSGKTLAYLLPCFQKLRELQFKQINGTGVIIITPTRELAIQVFDVAKKIGEFHNKTIGLLIGGMNRKMESMRLQKGVNLLICTPGRLLDHLQNSKFIYHNMFSLIIDEADALLRIGFEQEIADILRVLPKNRQTVLFSATQTRKIEDLAKLSLQNPIYIGVDDMNPTATVQSLEQGFVVINAANKFRLLLTFLRKEKLKKKKIMVFFSSCNSVMFYSDLLNYIDVNVMDIHGKQKQQKRSTTFYEFGIMQQGILLCTDVAARGLDIPQVDWIVQYDPPQDIREYIHRVGRTCRGSSATGRALLLLLEQQKGYLKHLLQAKVDLNEYEFAQQKLQQIQDEFELLIEKNRYLFGEANTAFKSYLHAYTTYSLKEVFNVHSLDLRAVAKSYGLKKPPHVDLNIKLGGPKTRKLKQKSNH